MARGMRHQVFCVCVCVCARAPGELGVGLATGCFSPSLVVSTSPLLPARL